MQTFALIAEGKTDQLIIESLIFEICGQSFGDDIEVNYLQPLRDSTDASRLAPHGGWELVLEYCRLKCVDALSTNDFVVVHIDTDCGDHVNFGLNLTDGGVDRPWRELVEDAQTILINAIGESLYSENKQRILFAVSVHSIETWILFYLYDVEHLKNSFQRLDRELRRSDKDTLVKTLDRYRPFAKAIKLKKLKPIIGRDCSFGYFLSKLTDLHL